MSDPALPSPTRRALRAATPWVLVVLGYLALAALLLLPVALAPMSRAVGLATPDAMDTAQLRWVMTRSDPAHMVFAPPGYPVGALVPNLLDHWLAAPLVGLLPWPLADNLWWWLALAANGIAAHLVGWRVGGSHRAGVLAGVAFAASEPVLREANFGHSPQALACFLPLALLALDRAVRPQGRWWHGVGLGVAVALAGMAYWYQALFFAALGLPVLIAGLWRGRAGGPALRVALGAAVCLVLVALPLARVALAWGELAHTDPASLPMKGGPWRLLPEHARFVASQGGSLLWPLGLAPPDRANRLPIVLAIAAGWGTWRASGQRWRWLAAAAVGGIMLMGPYLIGITKPVVLFGTPIPLPFGWLADLHPWLGRMHWPQRWGIVVPLALLPLVARAGRPLWLAGALLVEMFVLSKHLPLAWTAATPFSGWTALQSAPGAVMVFPLQDHGLQMGTVGLVHRQMARPLAAPINLPPGTPAPTAWEAWVAREDIARGLVWSPDVRSGADAAWVSALRTEGVSAVALDVTPGGRLADRDVDAWRQALSPLDALLGRPLDYGSALVWWLDPPDPVPPGRTDGEAWRVRQREALAAIPGPGGGFEVMPWNVEGSTRTPDDDPSKRPPPPGGRGPGEAPKGAKVPRGPGPGGPR